jgi:hypothetical protein
MSYQRIRLVGQYPSVYVIIVWICRRVIKVSNLGSLESCVCYAYIVGRLCLVVRLPPCQQHPCRDGDIMRRLEKFRVTYKVEFLAKTGPEICQLSVRCNMTVHLYRTKRCSPSLMQCLQRLSHARSRKMLNPIAIGGDDICDMERWKGKLCSLHLKVPFALDLINFGSETTSKWLANGWYDQAWCIAHTQPR